MLLQIFTALSPLFGLLFFVTGVLYGPDLLDRLTKGRLNKDGDSLVLIAASMLNDHENWLIDRDRAKYPREGAPQIYVYRDDKKLYYDMISMDLTKVPVTGYFFQLFDKAMNEEHKERKIKSLHTSLFQGKDPQLYLSDLRK